MPNIDLVKANPRHMAYGRLVLARNDIRKAKTPIKYIRDWIFSSHEPLYDPLCCAAVVSYARPFTTGRNYPSIPAKYSKFEDADFKSLHEFVIEARNTIHAHSDSDINIVSVMESGVEVTWNGGQSKGTLTAGDNISTRIIKREVFQEFEKLCDFQIARLEEAIRLEKELLFGKPSEPDRTKSLEN